MSDFDPYHRWLGIPPDERPISKYRLLGIAEFESDPSVIIQAATQRTVYLRHFQAGEKTKLVINLLNEVADARATLLNAVQKTAYDKEMLQQQKESPGAATQIVPVVQVSNAGSYTRKKPNTRRKRTISPVLSVILGGLASVPVSLLVLKYVADVDVLGLWPHSSSSSVQRPSRPLKTGSGSGRLETVEYPKISSGSGSHPETTADAMPAQEEFQLGKRYYDGIGVRQDVKEAIKWFRLAAERGHKEARARLGEMYYVGAGVEQDYNEAAKWFRLAAEQGHGNAQNYLGIMYNQGKGVSANDKMSVKWLLSAAEQKHEEARNRLGQMYYVGAGVDKDYKEAAKWFLLAAAQGHADSQNFIGYMYSQGYGVKQDVKEAIKWIALAAEQGHATAQDQLGDRYANGKGVPQNDKAAVKWFREAALQGNLHSQAMLGYHLGLGRGVPQDFAQSYIWLSLAVAGGDINAKDSCDKMRGMLSPDQIFDAQKQASELFIEIEGRQKLK